jgi:hypothetical protein
VKCVLKIPDIFTSPGGSKADIFRMPPGSDPDVGLNQRDFEENVGMYRDEKF